YLLSGSGTLWRSDTWEYDGTTWLQVAGAGPSARHDHAMAYDLARGRTLLFGGSDAGGRLSDTWEYDGSTWSQLNTTLSPMARDGRAMIYQVARGRMLAFDYDTWEFIPAATPTFTRHGLGCPGSAGTPSLDAPPNAVPALGTAFPLQLAALPPQPGFAYLAFGNVIGWNGAPIPVSLTPFGLTGCELWVAPAIGTLLPTQNGAASLSLPIPANPALAGVTLGAQAFSFDSAAPSGLGAVSNGVILRCY
ncbi:MAG TPA: hypothetical protein VK348_06470, partial [Planctomycetota bacterium]|nr:hypothetical protein [Planctomycetota bacterium]